MNMNIIMNIIMNITTTPTQYLPPAAETPRKFTDEEIDAALTALDGGSYGAILRAKGIVPAVDGGWIHFDYVPFEHNVRRGSAEVTGRLCVIGAELKEDEVSALFHI